MKVSEQIKWVAVGWFLYGLGLLLMSAFGIEPFEGAMLFLVETPQDSPVIFS